MKVALALIALALTAAASASQQPAKPAEKTVKPASQSENLPPVSYVCPMVGDEEVIEDKPGRCRKCGMELKPIRLDTVWTCPLHAAVTRSAPGKCPLDGRDLLQMTMALSWSCTGSATDSLTPGKCPDGSPMAKKFTPRPHGNHNPQHGGLFFMASDNWHHLEGTYPRAGVFRMYLYDDFTKPLPRSEMRKITARVLTKDGTSVPLSLAPNGQYLEAKVAKAAVPAELAAKVKFKADAPESHFDFAFAATTKEPPPGTAPAVNAAASGAAAAPPTAPAPNPAAPPAPAAPSTPAATPPATAATADAASSNIDPGLVPLPIPDTVPEMVTQLSQRTQQIKRFIDQGAFASVYVPAFQAKDLALALDERKKDLPAEHLKIVEPAIKRLVRSAWLLDAFGDLGNKEQITAAYAQFAAAVKDVESVFPGR
jgi:Heavy metal binding domain